LTRVEWNDLDQQLREQAGRARVQAWLFKEPPDLRFYGDQKDEESMFL
jgi:hypothetical protein